MTDTPTLQVQFPHGIISVPAFLSPDHAMYAGMPGNLELHPCHYPGWKLKQEFLLTGVRWTATKVGEDDASR